MKVKKQMSRTLSILFYALFCTLLLSADFKISGSVVDEAGEKVMGETVLLLKSDGTESQRTETSKARFGIGGGTFTFKKVLPGEYTIQVDAGERGKASVNVWVGEADVKDLAVTLSTAPAEKPPAETAAEPGEAGEATPTGTAGAATTTGSDYVINELSFELKKLSAEVKNINAELEDLKALSKMWVNPLAIYSKEIILKNGSTVFGKIVYQDEETIKVETLVGYLVIERKNVVRVIDNVVTEETQEYVPEQIRESYTPPPMPKLAEPRYTSATPTEREADKRFSANCVLVGNINEKKDTQGNIIFSGEVKNIGGRRADFVKVDFVFRKNWSGETKTLTTFVRGTYHTFESGITTDATLLPGATGSFELYVPHSFGSFIGYSYVLDWEEYE